MLSKHTIYTEYKMNYVYELYMNKVYELHYE